jgi:exopolysaccharide production protein ExoQ
LDKGSVVVPIGPPEVFNAVANAGGRGESPAFLGKGATIVSEPLKSNRALPGETPATAPALDPYSHVPRTGLTPTLPSPEIPGSSPGRGGSGREARRGGGGTSESRAWHDLGFVKYGCAGGLGICLFLLPAILALVPRGAAPLVAVAGLCAVPVIAANRVRGWPVREWHRLRVPAALLGLLLLWGGVSALWAIEPARALVKDLQLAGLFAAALVLAAAACAVEEPRRLAFLTIAGSGLGLVLACGDLGTNGGLSHYVTVRHFAPPRLNQIAVWLAIMLLPVAAFLWGRGSRLLGLAAASLMGATVFLLDGTAAKTALLLSLPVAALLYLNRRLVAAIAAALIALAVLTAPLTLPALADHPFVLRHADTFKISLGHRLYIWDFAGKRIAEHPLIGWGLDAARAIPGGKAHIRPGEDWMPLHPHDSALQVWLELGLPGAVLFALLLGWLWLRLGAVAWPPLYAAACGGSLAAAIAVLSAGWGIWQEWWLATLGLAAFAIIAMARTAEPSSSEPATPPPRRGSRACGR